ncbi:MAG: alpha/beta fold hydrolase [Bacteroidota bacterium]
MKEGWVKINEKQIHYQWINREYPPEPYLIFLHEGLGSIPQWRRFPEKVSHMLKMPALLYERAGYGKSSPAQKERPKDFLKTEGEIVLPQLLHKLNAKGKHYAFGHSDGGSVALYYASVNPDNLQKIIVVAPHVFLEDISRKGISKTRDAFMTGKLKTALKKFHAPHTDHVVLSWTNYWLDPVNKNWNMFEELTKITCPVCFIQGDNDMFGSYSQAEEIEKRVRGPFEKMFLNDCGHSPHFEKTSEVLDCVRLFFR